MGSIDLFAETSAEIITLHLVNIIGVLFSR